jgi:hypothetical protein
MVRTVSRKVSSLLTVLLLLSATTAAVATPAPPQANLGNLGMLCAAHSGLGPSQATVAVRHEWVPAPWNPVELVYATLEEDIATCSDGSSVRYQQTHF